MKTTKRGQTPGFLPWLACLLAVPAFGQEAPEPAFDLLGSVTQKITYTAADWDAVPDSAWALTTDLRPQFTYGPLKFTASTTWTLPTNANLTSVAPTVVLPEAYFRLTLGDSLDVTMGQKRFSLGVGQTFTVGDSLNPVIGFFDQKTGFRGFTAEWSPVSWASISGAASTESGKGDDWTGAAQVSLLWDQLQLTGSVVARNDKTVNPAVGLSYDVLGIIFTAEGAAEYLPQGVRPSGAANTWAAPDAWTAPAYSGSAGARWNAGLGDWDVTLSAEYLHWAQGWNADETDAWKTAWNSTNPAVKLLAKAARAALPLRSQENAFFRAVIVYGTAVSLSGFAAVDLQDQSVLGQGVLTFTPWDNLDLTATVQAAQGDTDTAWEYINPATSTRYSASLSTTYHF